MNQDNSRERYHRYVFVLIEYPGMKIIGMFSTRKFAEECSKQSYNNGSSTVHIFRIPYRYMSKWHKLINYIESKIACDVCGGIVHCFCELEGLDEYIVSINMKKQSIVLKKECITTQIVNKISLSDCITQFYGEFSPPLEIINDDEDDDVEYI